MGELAVAEPVLTRLRAALDAAYGDRLDRIVLFGSRARGDHRPDSDYDVAVFIRDPGGLWDELGVIAPITTDILVDTGAFITALPFAAVSYGDSAPVLSNIRRDGIDL